MTVIPPEPRCSLIPEKSVPHAKLNSEGLDRVMPAFVGLQPPVFRSFESMHFELTGFHDNDGVVTPVDGVLVDPKLPFVRRSISLFGTVSRRILDDDRWGNQFFPEDIGASIVAIEIGRYARYIKPIGRNRPSLGWVGEPPVDSRILADGEVLVRMEALKNGPNAAREQEALG